MTRINISQFINDSKSKINGLVKKDRKSLIILISIIFIPFLIICVLVSSLTFAFFKYKNRSQPARPVYIIFDDYSSNILKISEHLKDDDNDSGLDPDSFNRELNKGSELINKSEKNIEELNVFLKTRTSSKYNNYKKYLNVYIDRSKPIIDIEKEITKIYDAYIEPLRISEEITNTMPSFYSYTDTEKYIRSLEEAINKENEIIKTLQKVQVTGDVKLIHEVTVNRFKNEQDYLKKIKDAVLSKDDNDLMDVDVEYRKTQQENAKEFSRLNDKLKDNVNTIMDDLSPLKSQIDKETNKLGVYRKL